MAREVLLLLGMKPTKDGTRGSHAAEAGGKSRAGKRVSGTHTTADELVDMSRSVIDRVRPYVERAALRVKSKLNR